MPVAPVTTNNEEPEIINPAPQDPENNLNDSADVTQPEPRTVVTQTKITSTEIVSTDDPWISTTASDDPAVSFEPTGMKMTCDYYRRIMDKDDLSDVVNEYTPAPYQQYFLVKNYTLFVQDDLTGEEGEAIVIDMFVPTIGDHIVVKLSGNRKALLKVESVRLVSVLSAVRSHTITYKIISITDSDYTDLNNKVIQTYYYDERLARHTKRSALTSEELTKFREKLERLSNVEHEWLSLFYDMQVKTFVYQDVTAKVYHPSVSLFVEKTFSVALPDVKRYYDFEVDSIFDAMVERRKPRATQSETTELITLSDRNPLPALNGIAYTDISHVVYLNPMQSSGMATWMTEQRTEKSAMAEMFTASPPTAPQRMLPDITSVTGHLFDIGWMDGTEKSVLEEVLYQWLTQTPMSSAQLDVLLSAYDTLSLSEKYCYGPIILFLAKMKSRD